MGGSGAMAAAVEEGGVAAAAAGGCGGGMDATDIGCIAAAAAAGGGMDATDMGCIVVVVGGMEATEGLGSGDDPMDVMLSKVGGGANSMEASGGIGCGGGGGVGAHFLACLSVDFFNFFISNRFFFFFFSGLRVARVGDGAVMVVEVYEDATDC